METLLSDTHDAEYRPVFRTSTTFGCERLLRVRNALRISLAMLLGFLCAPRTSRAAGPDAGEILKQTAAVYQNLKSYQASIIIQDIEGTNVAERHFTETGSGNSFRSEEADARGFIRVSDGHNQWAVNRATNEYTKLPAAKDSVGIIGQLARIDQNVKDASTDDEELYWLNGNPIKVYIVEVTRTSWPAGSPTGAQWVTYTIDEQTHEVYKSITYTNGLVKVGLYSLTLRNQPVAGNVFAFNAGSSAKEVSSLPAEKPNYKPILGMQAPDFTLKNAAGKTYSLRDFKGKAVVIDFVGSWCPPCLAQMPYLQQVNDSYPPADLAVIGLDIGEEAKQVGEFALNSNFTFPMLVGAEPDVTQKYFVGDYPTTYVIDRSGHIVFKSTGTENPGGFLAAVKAAIAKKD
jgi:peroxiredoxin/outer membrane lipoprotein-sorting protein